MTQFLLTSLPYAYDALEPHMSSETLEYHHDKHHKTYVDKANTLIKDTDLAGKSLEEVVKQSYKTNKELFNNAAQHYNHIHFWNWMKKGGGKPHSLPKALEKAINESFGGIDGLEKKFIEAANTQFGSGWAWLMLKEGQLEILKSPNGENPLIHNAEPILGVDVWEHSYYLDHRNVRASYTKVFWDHLVNWDYVIELFEKASK